MNRSLTPSPAQSLASKALPLVIGIGSPHGDDRVGWDVVERLLSQPDSQRLGEFRKAAVPHDVLDWLESERTIHLVDAMVSDADEPLRLTIASNPQGALQVSLRDESDLERDCLFPRLQSNSTHQFELLAVLQLAHALGTLPRQLVLWALPIGLSKPELECQPRRDRHAAEQLVLRCLRRIRQELGPA